MSEDPSFWKPFSPFGEKFEGPLYRVLDYDGSNAIGQPLPRLLLEFFRRFNSAVDIWRNRDPIFWAQNTRVVIRIARSFIRDRRNGKHGLFRHYNGPLDEIVLGCGCCSRAGPCLLCEFNSHYIAYLFRAQRPQIRAYQAIADVFKCYLPNFDLKYHFLIPHQIAEYIGPPLVERAIKRLTGLTRKALFFVQESRFAPEIKSIINRGQFNSWARAVKLQLLRPWAQPTNVPGLVFGENWPLPAWRLRAFPAISLDPPFTRLIRPRRRTIYFLEIDDIYPRLDPFYVQLRRSRNQDVWENRGEVSEYLGFDTALEFPWFPVAEVEQEFSEAEELSEDDNL
jgi:hypothetical protein